MQPAFLALQRRNRPPPHLSRRCATRRQRTPWLKASSSCKKWNPQIDALRLALGTQSCLAEPAIAIDPEKLRPIIKSLLALLAEDDMRSAELATLNSAQLQALLGKNYHQLNQLLGNFDFPSALDLLQKALADHPELR